MRRHLIVVVIAFAALITFASVAQATIISGTWSVSVTTWGPCVGAPSCSLPGVPTNASARIGFDNGVFYPNSPVPPADFSTNFGADQAAFTYEPAIDHLGLLFEQPSGMTELLFTFDPASSASPTANVRWLISGPLAHADAATFTATFTPASAVPEPSALLLFLVGLGVLGLIRHQSDGYSRLEPNPACEM